MQSTWKPNVLSLLVLCTIAILPVYVAAKNFAKPVANAASSYPAHDNHTTEKVAIAADPYDTADKVKIFSLNFEDHGLLPVFFVVTNDGDQPISIANMSIKLITANHSKLTPLAPDDIYRRLSNPQANTNSPLPFPIPRKKAKGIVSAKDMVEIDSAQFAARAVEPHSTQSGFLFFDVGDIATPLARAHIDVTGIADARGSELMYFEISIENYLNPPKQ